MPILRKDLCRGKNMAVMVLNKELADEILEGRNGFDRPNRREEVWDGVTYIMPEADNEHDDIGGFFRWVFRSVFDPELGFRVHGSVNISDRSANWKKSYRVPDFSFFDVNCTAEDRKSHWFGGPDIVLEVVSPDDKSRDKLEFYAKVGSREVMMLDRDPWQLELYQLHRGELKLAGKIKPGDGKRLASSVVPFEYQLLRSRPRPKVKIVHTESGQEWVG